MSISSTSWYALAAAFCLLEVFFPGVMMMWLGMAALPVAAFASVARWPWPMQVLAYAACAAAAGLCWRRYERKA